MHSLYDDIGFNSHQMWLCQIIQQPLDKTNIFDRFPRAGVVVIDVERIYKLDNTLEAGIQIA